MHEALGFISGTFHRKVSVSGYMFKSVLVHWLWRTDIIFTPH